MVAAASVLAIRGALGAVRCDRQLAGWARVLAFGYRLLLVARNCGLATVMLCVLAFWVVSL